MPPQRLKRLDEARWRWAAIDAIAFLGWTAAVAVGLLDRLDRAATAVVRPDDEWLWPQVLCNHFVDRLEPGHAVWVPAVVALVACVVRRSVRPAVLAAGTGAVTAAAVVAVKTWVAQPDGRGNLYNGGSYPSGHTVALVVCSGLTVLLVTARPPRRAWLVPAGLGVVMASCLVVIGAHWLSDVVGGVLLGMLVLAVLHASGLARWAAGPQGTPSPLARGRSRGRSRGW